MKKGKCTVCKKTFIVKQFHARYRLNNTLLVCGSSVSTGDDGGIETIVVVVFFDTVSSTG